jgi:hypothetical protein
VICDTPDFCTRVEDVYGHTVRHLTIRAATPEERKHVGDFWATGKPMKAKKYIVVDTETGSYLGAFGMVDGGNTRAEAVFWAERWASKNGGHFLRPDGWEKVVGALPERP